MVVDIGRRPGTRVEQTIAKAANQAKLMASRMGGEDRGGECLDAFNDCRNVSFHVFKYNISVIFGKSCQA